MHRSRTLRGVHAADAVRDDVAGAPCRWSQGDPWFGVPRDARMATAATVELLIPHEGGAMAVRLWTAPLRAATQHAAPDTREVFAHELAGFANLADFGVAVQPGFVRGEVVLFKVAPSQALRLDDTLMPWGGGDAVALRFAGDLSDAIARAVATTRWPPRSRPRLATGGGVH